MPAAVDTNQKFHNFQGIMVPASAVQPEAFFAATRRMSFQANSSVFPGFGQTLIISMLQVGIIAGLSIKFSGTLTTTTPTGAVATTGRWPYDLLRSVRFSANAQSNLINCYGSHLNVRDLMVLTDANDRGVARGIGGASPGTSRSQGTLSLSEEEWGVGQNVTAIPAAAYPVELNWFVPVAHDQQTLLGAIFAQTSSTDLVLQLDTANQSDLFTLTGTATATLTGTFTVEGIVYSIPQGPDGGILLPDLSAFHSIITSRQAPIANGMNELKLSGQGVGRQLMRIWWRTFGSTVTGVPLRVDATNYASVGWRYGANETPELYTDGRHVAQMNERTYGVDIGQFAGFGAFDFANEFAFRDSVDQGSATELRLLLEIPAAVSLTAPATEYTQEVLFSAAVGA